MQENRTNMKNIREEYRKYFASVYYGSKITDREIIKLVFIKDSDYEDDYGESITYMVSRKLSPHGHKLVFLKLKRVFLTEISPNISLLIVSLEA